MIKGTVYMGGYLGKQSFIGGNDRIYGSTQIDILIRVLLWLKCKKTIYFCIDAMFGINGLC